MPEALLAALETPGLIYLILAGTAAAIVYGFAGFGSALVFTPVAIVFVDPVTAIAGFALSSLGSMISVLPGAWREADRRASLTILAAAIAFLPLGVLVLRITDPFYIRVSVSLLVAATLVLLMTGWRYEQKPGLKSWIAVGSGVGFLGGSTGLNGPLLILFQLGGQDAVARTRANTIVVLTLSGFAILPVMALQGVLTAERLWIGAILVPTYAVGGFIGRSLFDPDRAGLYRRVAYAIIGIAALVGLPIWE